MRAIEHSTGPFRHFLTKLRSPLASCPDGFEIGGRLGSDVARRDDQRMPEILRADDIGEGVVAGGLHRFRNRQRQLFQRSEENTSELQSLMRISYADFCVKKKTQP